MMRQTLRVWLGISDLEARVDAHAAKLDRLDDRVEGVRDSLGTVTRMSRKELRTLKLELNDLAVALKDTLETVADQDEARRGRDLLKRINRYRRTVDRHYEAA